MNRTIVALAAAFGIVILGFAILLVSEAVGANESFVVIGGIVALAGVGVLTGVVMRLPDPNEGEHNSGGDHIWRPLTTGSQAKTGDREQE